MIKMCIACKPHEYQDKRYGKNMRVMNFATKNKVWRCTVCTKEHS